MELFPSKFSICMLFPMPTAKICVVEFPDPPMRQPGAQRD
jgi:hypothetical protein